MLTHAYNCLSPNEDLDDLGVLIIKAQGSQPIITHYDPDFCGKNHKLHMADATSLYSSPEPRVYVKKISWYLNLEIIVIRKLCPNGKCLAVTLLFGNMA